MSSATLKGRARRIGIAVVALAGVSVVVGLGFYAAQRADPQHQPPLVPQPGDATSQTALSSTPLPNLNLPAELSRLSTGLASCDAALDSALDASSAGAAPDPWLTALKVRARGPRATASELASVLALLSKEQAWPAQDPSTPQPRAPLPFLADPTSGLRLTLIEAKHAAPNSSKPSPASTPPHSQSLRLAARLAQTAVPAAGQTKILLEPLERALESALLGLEHRVWREPGEGWGPGEREATLVLAQTVFHSLVLLPPILRSASELRARRAVLRLRQTAELNPALVAFQPVQLQQAALSLELSASVAALRPEENYVTTPLLNELASLLDELQAAGVCSKPNATLEVAALIASSLRALRLTRSVLSTTPTP